MREKRDWRQKKKDKRGMAEREEKEMEQRKKEKSKL